MIHVHHPVLVGQTALYLGKKYKIPVAYTYHTRYEEYLHHFKLYEAIASGEYPGEMCIRDRSIAGSAVRFPVTYMRELMNMIPSLHTGTGSKT